MTCTISSNVMTFKIAGELQTLYRCYGCDEWFEPGVPWDTLCIQCYEQQMETIIDALAEREAMA